MVEPVGLIAGAGLKVAGERVKKILDDAEAAKAEDLARALDYVRAAREAVWSLEQECDAILSDAALCDLENRVAIDALLARIERYLHEDHIRPHLVTAVQGLRDSRDMLATQRKAVLAWPWKQENKKKAVDDFGELLESLATYLERLVQEMRSLPAGSGPQAWRLGLVRDELSGVRQGAVPGDARRRVDDLVSEARLDPTKGGWLELTRRCEALSNDLRTAFR
jgi:hypothetical protein